MGCGGSKTAEEVDESSHKLATAGAFDKDAAVDFSNNHSLMTNFLQKPILFSVKKMVLILIQMLKEDKKDFLPLKLKTVTLNGNMLKKFGVKMLKFLEINLL